MVLKRKKPEQPPYDSKFMRANKEGIIFLADKTDDVLDWTERVPVVKQASGKWRKRLRGLTKPTKELLKASMHKEDRKGTDSITY